jgi:hypothetical protein
VGDVNVQVDLLVGVVALDFILLTRQTNGSVVAQNIFDHFIFYLNKTPVSASISKHFCSKLPANARVSSIYNR